VLRTIDFIGSGACAAQIGGQKATPNRGVGEKQRLTANSIGRTALVAHGWRAVQPDAGAQLRRPLCVAATASRRMGDTMTTPERLALEGTEAVGARDTSPAPAFVRFHDAPPAIPPLDVAQSRAPRRRTGAACSSGAWLALRAARCRGSFRRPAPVAATAGAIGDATLSGQGLHPPLGRTAREAMTKPERPTLEEWSAMRRPRRQCLPRCTTGHPAARRGPSRAP